MSVPETELPQAATAASGLRRNLKLWQVVAVSIGVMAPSLAISLEPQGAVSTVGRAIPLTYLLAVVTLLVCTWLAIVPVKRGTSVVLICEAITVTLILIGAVVVFVRLAGGSAPGHQDFTMSVFSPAPGTSPSSLFIGVVFGFLSFAGFEAAAVFGAEAERPRRNIPRAIVGTTVVIGLFYLVVATASMMGFGTSGQQVAAFGASPSLMGTLGSSYISPWFGDLVTLGTVISGFSCTLACVVGASRMIYTIGRDATGGRSVLGQVSARYGTPVTASLVVAAAALAGAAIFGWGMSAAPFDVFVWTSTIGTLLLLVVYLIVTAAAIRVLFFSGDSTVARWEIVIPVLAAVVLIYTLYKNVHPAGEPNWEPITALVWLVLALVALVVAPGVTTRLGQRLAADEGLAADERLAAPMADLAAPDA